MPAEIRDVTLADLPLVVELLIQDARSRQAHDPTLWALADGAQEKVEQAIKFALTAENQPFRQKWLVAEADDKIVGIIHSVLLPVPPIYAGRWGDPGLLMPECFVTPDAPFGTIKAIVEAAEADLRGAGAELLLASFVSGDDWLSHFEKRGYKPLTLYLAKVDLEETTTPVDVRTASEEDIAEIVRRSSENRKILEEMDVFWTPHAEADDRFGNWMKRSITMKDRDMLVIGSPNTLDGYVIAQPASHLHFPPAHDITATGVIDDYFHREFSDPAKTQDGGEAAASLLHAAEAAFVDRGIKAALVVCPAAWTSKISVLENAGYKTAIVWMINR